MRSAYTSIVTEKGFAIGRADEGIQGYTPCPQFGTFETEVQAKVKVLALNTDLGIGEKEALMIVISTMRGRKPGQYIPGGR